MNTICSFDVGITHLAFCILEKSNEEDIPYNIIEWNIINTMDDDDMRKLKCLCHTQKKKLCGKNPKYYIVLLCDYENYKKGTVLGFCKNHVDDAEQYRAFNIYCIENIFSMKEGKKCSHLLRGKDKCEKASRYTWNNDKYFCKTHGEAYVKKAKEQYDIIPFKRSKINKKPIKEIQINLFKLFDKHPQFLKVSEIVIENQPSLKNPTMKSIASAISNYFLIRGIIDGGKNNSNIKNVQFICPSNKLKIDNDNTVSVLGKSVDGKKYKLTKELGIKYCRKLLQYDQTHLAFLESFKKKDDLCDAFLQGVYYLDYYKKKNKC